jgi:hypothetical protein
MYKIWKDDEPDSIGSTVIEPVDLSAGYVYSDDSMVICFDTIRYKKEKFEFKKVDTNRMMVVFSTPHLSDH